MGRIMSVKTLSERRYHTMETLPSEWTAMFGVPERNFRMMIYGPSTSGKSVLALRFANALAKHIGKTLYNSFEEGHNKTISDRIREHKIDAPKLYVADRMSFEDLVINIRKKHYRIVVLDSVKFMHLTYDQYKELIRLFPRKCFIFINHGPREGSVDKGKEILEAVDIKVFVRYGKAKISSRYSGEVKEVTLFTIKQYSNHQSQTSLL